MQIYATISLWDQPQFSLLGFNQIVFIESTEHKAHFNRKFGSFGRYLRHFRDYFRHYFALGGIVVAPFCHRNDLFVSLHAAAAVADEEEEVDLFGTRFDLY